MNAHVSNIARTCYFELRCLASIPRFLTSTATATLVSQSINQSINQGIFSIQTNNNNNIHTFVYMNTERAGNEVKLLI